MKKIYLLAALALSLAACDQNTDSPSPAKIETKVSAVIGDNTPSRATHDSWVAGDQIGITAYVGPEARPHINMRYKTADGQPTFTGNPIYYYNGMVLNAYYPFTGDEGTAPGDAGVITANTRIGNQKKLADIDFLWDSQTGMTGTNPNVNFTFAHKMSKVTFVFKRSSQTDVKDIEGYEVIGLKLDGTFNTDTGVCAPVATATTDSVKVDLNKGTLTDGKETEPLIFFPQTLEANQVKLRLYLNEIEDNTDPDLVQKYTCPLKFDGGELKAGHHYKFSIIITKAGLNVGTVSIENWIDEEPVDDKATLDGTPFEE